MSETATGAPLTQSVSLVAEPRCTSRCLRRRRRRRFSVALFSHFSSKRRKLALTTHAALISAEFCRNSDRVCLSNRACFTCCTLAGVSRPFACIRRPVTGERVSTEHHRHQHRRETTAAVALEQETGAEKSRETGKCRSDWSTRWHSSSQVMRAICQRLHHLCSFPDTHTHTDTNHRRHIGTAKQSPSSAARTTHETPRQQE